MDRPFAIAAALGAGAALFLIVALPALRTGASAFAQGATGWIERPRWWAPLALFNKGVGSFAFPVMAALAGWGAWRGWVRARAATAFALAWMWLPPLLMLVASYAFSPMFVERYALWCFVPFFTLAALGAWERQSASMRAAAIGLAVALALGHLHAYGQRPHDTQWREAARAAAGALAPGMKIAVAPPYAVNVMRYYLRDTQAAEAACPRMIPMRAIPTQRAGGGRSMERARRSCEAARAVPASAGRLPWRAYTAAVRACSET